MDEVHDKSLEALEDRFKGITLMQEHSKAFEGTPFVLWVGDYFRNNESIKVGWCLWVCSIILPADKSSLLLPGIQPATLATKARA